VIPASVRKELEKCLESDAPHFRTLENKIERVRNDPFSGGRVREDLPECYFIELGDFRMYYYVDDVTKEVRFFLVKRFMMGW